MCRKLKNMKAHICDHQNTCFIKLEKQYKCFINQNSYSTFSPFFTIKKHEFEEKKENNLGHHCQPSVDGGGGFDRGDFIGEGEGAGIGFLVVASKGIVVGGG